MELRKKLKRDALFDLPHHRYVEWLEVLYTRMAQEIPPDATVLEVGTRTYRGVITPDYIPCKSFVAVDRDRHRPGLNIDVTHEAVHADAIISTCVLHHTPEHIVPQVLGNLHAPLLVLSGPNADTHRPYGDHEWHLEEAKLRHWLYELGYLMTWERIGLTEPFCEALVVARRVA